MYPVFLFLSDRQVGTARTAGDAQSVVERFFGNLLGRADVHLYVEPGVRGWGAPSAHEFSKPCFRVSLRFRDEKIEGAFWAFLYSKYGVPVDVPNPEGVRDALAHVAKPVDIGSTKKLTRWDQIAMELADDGEHHVS